MPGFMDVLLVVFLNVFLDIFLVVFWHVLLDVLLVVLLEVFHIMKKYSKICSKIKKWENQGIHE